MGAQTTAQRWWADPLVNLKGEDRTIRTVFTHDHFAPSSHQQHGFYGGLIVEPAGSRWRDPETGVFFGSRADGGPTSYRADILFDDPGNNGYREFNLAFADFALLFDAFGEPVNAPTFKEAALPKAIEHPVGVRLTEVISAADPGSMLINYRHEPLPLRLGQRKSDGTFKLKVGEMGLPHIVFRSDIHGDPFTPLLRAYEGDYIQINLIQGAQEEQHVFSINGHSWLRDISDDDSGLANAAPIGISEHIEFNLSSEVQAIKNPRGTADYLYQSTPSDDLWNGMWGILRAYAKPQPDLLPLGNGLPSGKNKPVHPCPAGAAQRRYEVHAITARGNIPGDRLVYNERFNLYDPDAILFVRKEHLKDLRAGKRQPEPLILRAAAGDCITIALVNDLPKTISKSPHWSHLPPITEGFNVNQVPISSHISLHPQLVTYDVNAADGPTVGFNIPQDVPPGKRANFTWYAGSYLLGNKGKGRKDGTPLELGAINLRSMSDVVNHGLHGGFGALIVEPFGATWTEDPGTSAQATVTFGPKHGPKESFREFVLIFQNEVALHSDRREFQCADRSLNCGTALRNLAGIDDAENSGHKAFNYRTEPFWGRLGIRPEQVDGHDGPGLADFDLNGILASTPFDPETPLFTAKAGEPMRVRVLMPSGHPLQHAFTLHGHAWSASPWALGSNSAEMGDTPFTYAIGTQGTIAPMTAFDIIPFAGAGGPYAVSGDWLYHDNTSFRFSDGLWGIVRVRP